MHSCEAQPSEEAHVRTKRWNMEDNSRSIPAFSLSSWHVVSFGPANAVNSAFLISSNNNLVVKKL